MNYVQNKEVKKFVYSTAQETVFTISVH